MYWASCCDRLVFRPDGYRPASANGPPCTGRCWRAAGCWCSPTTRRPRRRCARCCRVPPDRLFWSPASRLADLEGAGRVRVGGLSAEEALALLGKIAGPGRVETEPEAAARIVGACVGLPLALRIVGARLAASPARKLAELADAVSDSGAVLRELVIGDLSVSRRLDPAWRALSPASRRALRTLAEAGQRDFSTRCFWRLRRARRRSRRR